MSKVYVKDVKDKEPVKSVFRVAKKSSHTGKNGKAFLVLTLTDKTGELDARVWERVEELDAKLVEGELAEVEGSVVTFKGRLQLTITEAEKADPAAHDPADFVAPSRLPDDKNFRQIVELIDRVRDPNVRALLRSFVDDEELARDFVRAPAAKTIHHARAGGLCEHTLSVMRLAHRIADHYPMVDRDLLVAGAFLHDFGKVRELTVRGGETEYTDEGRLVGHLVMTAQWIHERAAKLPNFPRALAVHLTHLVLSHHGRLEYGSPKLPMTLEALLVGCIDEIDSRVASWLEIMERDSGRTWTDYQKLYDRHLYKGAPPTQHGRPPVEPRGRKRKEKEAGQPKQPREKQPAAAAPAGGEAAAPRPERPERRERQRKQPEEKLTFKPFAALSGPSEPVEEEPAQATPAVAGPTDAERPTEEPAQATPSVAGPTDADRPAPVESAAAEPAAPETSAAPANGTPAAESPAPAEQAPEKPAEQPSDEPPAPTDGSGEGTSA